jgi:hypothetical protein
MTISDKKIESRTVRFKPHELDRIDQFLAQNPFFDFSSLARIAIQKFIENPKLKVSGVKPQSTSNRRKRLEVDV